MIDNTGKFGFASYEMKFFYGRNAEMGRAKADSAVSPRPVSDVKS